MGGITIGQEKVGVVAHVEGRSNVLVNHVKEIEGRSCNPFAEGTSQGNRKPGAEGIVKSVADTLFTTEVETTTDPGMAIEKRMPSLKGELQGIDAGDASTEHGTKPVLGLIAHSSSRADQFGVDKFEDDEQRDSRRKEKGKD